MLRRKRQYWSMTGRSRPQRSRTRRTSSSLASSGTKRSAASPGASRSSTNSTMVTRNSTGRTPASRIRMARSMPPSPSGRRLHEPRRWQPELARRLDRQVDDRAESGDRRVRPHLVHRQIVDQELIDLPPDLAALILVGLRVLGIEELIELRVRVLHARRHAGAEELT